MKLPRSTIMLTEYVLKQCLKGRTLLPIIVLLVLTACTSNSNEPAYKPNWINDSYRDINNTRYGTNNDELSDSNCETRTPLLELTVFNVSQGQSVLLRIPKREGTLIVGGALSLDNAGILNTQYTNIVYDAGPKIKGQPLPDTIDQLIISNPDRDHLAGAAWILDVKQVNRLIMPGILPCNTNTCAMVQGKAENEPGMQIITAYTGDRIYKEDTPSLVRVDCHTNTTAWAEQRSIPHTTATIEYLNPDPLEPFNTDNDNSIVLLVTYFNTTILLMGDCESKCENKLIEQHYPRDVDVLVVSHHGSKTSSSIAFLEMTSPRVALISAGKDNQYGHPSPEVIQRLTNVGATIHRTDQQGTINVTTDGSNVEVST